MDLMETIKKVPWWGWVAGGGAALGATLFVRKNVSNGQQNASQQVSSAPIPAGLNAADLAGLPFDYQDYEPANPLGTIGSDAASTPVLVPPPTNPPGWPFSPPGPIPPQPAPGDVSTGASGLPFPGISPTGAPGPIGPYSPPPDGISLQYGENLAHLPTENPWLQHAHPPIA